MRPDYDELHRYPLRLLPLSGIYLLRIECLECFDNDDIRDFFDLFDSYEFREFLDILPESNEANSLYFLSFEINSSYLNLCDSCDLLLGVGIALKFDGI